MNNLPLVSVIIPAYNCSESISETLSSIFDQNYPEIEIIVINDGSKDNTLDVLNKFIDRIILIDQVNGGPSAARNAGIRVAKGDFISFCDADDIWARCKVSEQVNFLLAHQNVEIVYCGWHVWNQDSDGKFNIPEDFNSYNYPQEIEDINSGWIYHKLLLDCICLTSTVMLRARAVNKIGFFNIELPCGEDYNYWLRASRITEIYKLKSKFVLYRALPQSITRTPATVYYEYDVLQDAISRWGIIGPNGEKNSPDALRNRFATMLFGFGYLHFNSGNPFIAIKSFWKSFLVKPFWHLPWIYLLLSFGKCLLASLSK